MDYEKDILEIRDELEKLSNRIIETIKNEDIGDYITMYGATNEALWNAMKIIDTVMSLKAEEEEDESQ
jgi:hypothetical protein